MQKPELFHLSTDELNLRAIIGTKLGMVTFYFFILVLHNISYLKKVSTNRIPERPDNVRYLHIFRALLPSANKPIIVLVVELIKYIKS